MNVYRRITKLEKNYLMVKCSNDFNLNIPLSIDKVIEDNLPSVDEAMAQLKSAWKESQQADEYFKTKLAKYIA